MGIIGNTPLHANDIPWMQKALTCATQAAKDGEVPVGAVLVRNNHCLATAANAPIKQHDPSAHAEILTLRAAGLAQENYRLLDTTLYVTLEPCVMCLGAIMHARIKRLVFAASDPKTGAIASCCHLLDTVPFNHSLDWSGGLLANESSDLLTGFFKARRAQKKG